ncbi:amidohydrolase family protein [Selenihalanaerobacter shriftii]|uniref:5-methylthioadenosine/S-adenosylhomocysteine deaminase n=1 Tax=Selenihalanaerobacter shriftii TaxID=142842 RepID=A0A1T4MLL7_9FIRM|nr:amidohydrolase [Selenihalanaerobacter shriftii]SJZ67939.1 5-methylthioadenosine/S-adenosylhomocysteine deaminase [Selenihalanaerobacter shriftii]
MILTAKWVLPISAEPISPGAVVINDEEIEAVGFKEEVLANYPKEEVRDLGEAILLPGLINLHTHLDYTILRGENDNLPFLPWISNLVQKSRALEYDEVLLSAKLGALELLAAGVTTIADTTATGASLQAASEMKLRGIIYQEVFGMDDEQLEANLLNIKKRYNELKAKASNRLEVGLSPHAPYSVSRRLLQEVADVSQSEDIPLCMHVAETEEEIDFLIDGTGPFATTYREAVGWSNIHWDPPGIPAVRYLNDLGILNDRFLAVHLVQTDPEEIEILNELDVKAAYCPKSNAKLGAGIADLSAMLDAGVLVGLGTDSAASNNSLDLFSEMEFGLLLQRAKDREASIVTAKELVKMTTINGAKALGLEDKVGSLEPGKQADLTAVKISNFANQPVYNPYSALAYTASSRDIAFTMIGGEVLYDQGEFLDVAKEEMIFEFKNLQQKIMGL